MAYHRRVKFLLPPNRGEVRASARAAILADWMSAWLDDDVEVVTAESYRGLAQQLEAGDAALAWVPPAVCAKVRGHCRSVLTAIRDGRKEYAAALVVRRDSGIASIADLVGKRAAWVDPLSASGHLLAVAHLRSNGLDPAEALASESYAGTLRDALVQVAEAQADVTSTYMVGDEVGRTLEELRDIAGPAANELAILERTGTAPFDALTIGFDAPQGIEERLLGLKRRRSGAPAMLLEICRADGFVRADPVAFSAFEGFVERLL